MFIFCRLDYIVPWSSPACQEHRSPTAASASAALPGPLPQACPWRREGAGCLLTTPGPSRGPRTPRALHPTMLPNQATPGAARQRRGRGAAGSSGAPGSPPSRSPAPCTTRLCTDSRAAPAVLFCCRPNQEFLISPCLNYRSRQGSATDGFSLHRPSCSQLRARQTPPTAPPMGWAGALQPPFLCRMGFHA